LGELDDRMVRGGTNHKPATGCWTHSQTSQGSSMHEGNEGYPVRSNRRGVTTHSASAAYGDQSEIYDELDFAAVEEGHLV